MPRVALPVEGRGLTSTDLLISNSQKFGKLLSSFPMNSSTLSMLLSSSTTIIFSDQVLSENGAAFGELHPWAHVSRSIRRTR